MLTKEYVHLDGVPCSGSDGYAGYAGDVHIEDIDDEDDGVDNNTDCVSKNLQKGGGQAKGMRFTKTRSPKDYCNASDNNVYCLVIAIFWLATLAFFRFTDVIEFMMGITILYR